MNAKFFKCKKCSRIFGAKAEYKKHKQFHRNENNLTTPNPTINTINSEATPNVPLLKSESNASTPLVVPHTPSVYMQGDNPRTCTFCDKICKDVKAKDRHELTHTKPFQCHLCTKDFAEDYQLRAHIADGHLSSTFMDIGDFIGLPAKIRKIRAESSSTSDFESHQIETSPLEVFQESTALMSPISMSSSSGSSSICSTTINYTANQIKEKTSDQIKLVFNPLKMTSSYKCQICSEYFTKAITGVEHFEEFHSKLRKYKCSMCVEDFKIERELIKHFTTHED